MATVQIQATTVLRIASEILELPGLGGTTAALMRDYVDAAMLAGAGNAPPSESVFIFSVLEAATLRRHAVDARKKHRATQD